MWNLCKFAAITRLHIVAKLHIYVYGSIWNLTLSLSLSLRGLFDTLHISHGNVAQTDNVVFAVAVVEVGGGRGS